MKNKIICALIALMTAGYAFAAVPERLNFQGKLLDTSNNPRNGNYNMTFSIWNLASGGAQLWTETQSNVPVSNGVFAVQLGEVTPVVATVFAGATTYLQVQIGAEVSATRERLVAIPYAWRAAIADALEPGDTNYIQLRNTLQTGAVFHVSSATVSGQLTVGGTLAIGGNIKAGSGANQITTEAGLVDATMLDGTLPSFNLSGTYSNALTLGNAGNSFTGNGSGLSNVIAAGLLPGDTDYIQARDTLQAGATFYVGKGTVGGPFTATGAVTLGQSAGTSDVTVQSNLIVSGAGPHVFTGDVRVNGNNLQDSGGTNRITLGSENLINGSLGVPDGAASLTISTPMAFVGSAGDDNYISYPFTAGMAITNRNAVVVIGTNEVGTTTTANTRTVVGIATNSAGIGETVWVAVSGIITGVVGGSAMAVGDSVCTDTVRGAVDNCPTNNVASSMGMFGVAVTGSAAAGDTITMRIK